MLRLKMLAIGCVSALALGTSANALPIVNGSFELGTDPGGYASLSAGSTDLTGWQILGQGVDYVGTVWTASDGNRSVDLSAFNAGGIMQTLATSIGMNYDVVFDLAANPLVAGVHSLRVTAGGTSQIFTFDPAGNTLADMGWETNVFSFTATGASSDLVFESLMAGSSGPVIDAVSVSMVTPVPEPSTAFLMLSALSGFAAVRRRRPRA